jgi:hypothetical protein
MFSKTEKYIWLYRYSGKLALAAMYLRRVQLGGGQSTTDACLYRCCLLQKDSAPASCGPAGGRRVAKCSARWHPLPLRSPTRRWRALPSHSNGSKAKLVLSTRYDFFQMFQQIQKEDWA